VFEYVKTSLKATRVGLVFSPAKNREIGLQFLKAGSAQEVAGSQRAYGCTYNTARLLYSATMVRGTL